MHSILSIILRILQLVVVFNLVALKTRYNCISSIFGNCTHHFVLLKTHPIVFSSTGIHGTAGHLLSLLATRADTELFLYHARSYYNQLYELCMYVGQNLQRACTLPNATERSCCKWKPTNFEIIKQQLTLIDSISWRRHYYYYHSCCRRAQTVGWEGENRASSVAASAPRAVWEYTIRQHSTVAIISTAE
jgi:hypothetical protein